MSVRRPPALQRAKAGVALATLALAALWLAQALGLPVRQAGPAAVDYLPLHTLLESAAVLAAMLAFWLVWHADRASRPAGMLALAACMLGAALLDVAHALSFAGMPVFVTPAGRDKAAAFWLASRALMALGLLALGARWAAQVPCLRTRAALLAATLAGTAALAALLLWRPAWIGQPFDDGERLLPAKIAAEALLMALYGLAAARLLPAARAAAPGSAWLFAAAALGVPGEAAMTLYGASHDAFNLLGHLCKLGAVYALYRGVLQATLRQPLRQLGELAAALEATLSPILLSDAQGRIRWANQALCRATGYALDELIGEPAAQLDATGDGASNGGNANALAQAMREGRAWRGRLPTRRRDGSEYLDQRTVTPIRSDLDELSGFVWVGDDVSERERLEAEQQRLQRQLAQAQKMDALGQLTGGIAHDFNNMLTAILGLATLARERHVADANGKLALNLQEIAKVAGRGRDLVARLMRFARPLSQESAPEACVQALLPLVQEVLQMVRPALPPHIALELQAPPDLPPVRVQAVDLHQILTNLLLNARDAIDGEGRVRVELEALDGTHDSRRDCSSCARRIAGPQLALRVCDSGSGIPPAVQGRIFEPFFTTKEVGRGTGLGLAMVHSMVHELGGHLRVHSEPGATTIEILLPAVAPPAADQAPAAGAAGAPSARGGDGANRATERAPRVWVVDDDPVVLLYLSELLRLQGCELRSFGDPQAALQALQHEAPDWLLTDQLMPGLTGSELARQALQRWPRLAVVLCTGYSDQLDEAAARALGVRHYLRKPFEPQQLLRLICPSAAADAAGTAAPPTDPANPRTQAA